MTTTTTAPWLPAAHAVYDRLTGCEVFGADGEQLGSIAAVFHPAAEAPDARGGHVFLVEPDPPAASGDEDLYVAAAPLGGLLLRPDGPAGGCAGRGPLYVPEAAVAGVGAEGVTLACAGEELEAGGWLAEPDGFDGPNHA